MRARLGKWWRDLEDSLWFVPAVIAALYAALAVAMLLVDRRLGLGRGLGGEDWAFGGGADGARAALFAIAGTMISVIGVVFSLTIVALQIASAQFTPRVLRTFTGDRGTQVVLGVFLGTFAYALLVLRAIRSPEEEGAAAAFVPVGSVAVAIVLAIVSIGFMIYYIHHVARSVQVAVIIERVTGDTLGLIEEEGEADRGGSAGHAAWGPEPPEPGAPIYAEGDGYLQAVDTRALLAAAEGRGLRLRTEPLVGQFVLFGAPLATAWPAAAVDRETVDAIRQAFVLGPERTRQQDVELGLRQLADIAVKALSPAVNDPTTATLCLDRLAQLLVQVADWTGEEFVAGENGAVIRFRAPSFARLVDVAFAQIRRYGAGDPVLAAHLASTLGALSARVPPAAQAPLRVQAAALRAAAGHSLAVPADRERVEAALAWAGAEEEAAS